MVGMTGFEPATSSPPAKRATKLRHIPTCEGGVNLSKGLLASDVLNCFGLIEVKKIPLNYRLTKRIDSA